MVMPFFYIGLALAGMLLSRMFAVGSIKAVIMSASVGLAAEAATHLSLSNLKPIDEGISNAIRGMSGLGIIGSFLWEGLFGQKEQPLVPPQAPLKSANIGKVEIIETRTRNKRGQFVATDQS